MRQYGKLKFGNRKETHTHTDTLRGWPNTGTGCTERPQNFDFWKDSKPKLAWPAIRPELTGAACLEHGVRILDL